MKLVAFYLVFVLTVIAALGLSYAAGNLPEWLTGALSLPFLCTLAGGLGGTVYCFRAIYLNACVLKKWDDEWKPWYFIRPIVSMVCGLVSFLFLKSGLLVLEASQKQEATDLGFLALAFVAGLNVDKFITKIEDIAQAIWGIEKSRVAKGSSGADGGKQPEEGATK